MRLISRALLAADKVRYAAGDGKLADLTNNPPVNLVPWISENWSEDFKWRAKGPMPEAEEGMECASSSKAPPNRL